MEAFRAESAALLASWVDRQLGEFTPWHAPGETTPRSLQRFAELAIAYDALEGSPLALSAPAARWRPFIVAQLSDPAFGELARQRLDWAWALLLPYLVMRKRGYVDDYHDATLLLSRRAGFPDALEVVPYRALDYAYFAAASGLGTSTQSAAVLLDRTFAARASCRYLMNRESTYALTHTVFYASSFGRDDVPPSMMPGATALVDSMIVDCCVRKEFDLLGELLICSTVLAGCREHVRDLGRSVFQTALRDSDCILPNGAVRDRTFDDCYHPTLVGLILCACLVRPSS